jgi:hypothetical protein
MGVDAANPRYYSDMKGGQGKQRQCATATSSVWRRQPGRYGVQVGHLPVCVRGRRRQEPRQPVNLTDDNDLSAPDGLVFSQATGLCWIQTDDGAYTDKTNCMLLAAIPGQVGDGSKKTLSYKRADGSEKRVTPMLARPRRPHSQALSGGPGGLRNHRSVRDTRWPGHVHQHPAPRRRHQNGRCWQPRQIHQPVARQRRLRGGQAPALGHHRHHQKLMEARSAADALRPVCIQPRPPGSNACRPFL